MSHHYPEITVNQDEKVVLQSGWSLTPITVVDNVLHTSPYTKGYHKFYVRSSDPAVTEPTLLPDQLFRLASAEHEDKWVHHNTLKNRLELASESEGASNTNLTLLQFSIVPNENVPPEADDNSLYYGTSYTLRIDQNAMRVLNEEFNYHIAVQDAEDAVKGRFRLELPHRLDDDDDDGSAVDIVMIVILSLLILALIVAVVVYWTRHRKKQKETHGETNDE